MTRKNQVVVAAAVALTGIAVASAWLLTRDSTPPVEPTPSQTQAHQATPPDADQEQPVNPQVMAEVRRAFGDSLAHDSPPGILDLGSGSGSSGASDLPPLPPLADTNLTPAGYNSGPSADLPPLPPVSESTPELLPPPMVSVAEENKTLLPPPGDLPPLPPLPPIDPAR